MSEFNKPLGFWTCWSLTVGIMIGSGIFLLPSVLAKYGMMSFAGWALTAAGSITLALVIGRLATRTRRTGGLYIYVDEAFGPLTGFLMAWGYWAAYWIAAPAIAIAFVGYFAVFIPAFDTHVFAQSMTALGLIWGLTLINLVSLRGAGIAQILMTVLKLLPLILIIGLGLMTGQSENLPPLNPQNLSPVEALAATALLTMWAFSGLEAGAIPAADVKDPTKTIPRAIIFGTITVAFVYIASTLAVMLLVPMDVLNGSTSPFADAAKGLGDWGPYVVAAGALIATAGSLNGIIFITGQMPMALALDGLAPKVFSKKNKAGAPWLSLVFGSCLSTALLLMNYSKDLIEAFTFLVMMSTVAVLVPMLASAMAELKYSWRSSWAWAIVVLAALAYSVFAILGSGFTVIAWGIVLFAAGLPIYFWLRRAAR